MEIGINEVNEIIKNLESSGELSIKEEKYLNVAKLCIQLAAENMTMLRLLSDISENHVEYFSEGEDGMFAGVPLDYVSEINMYVSRDVNAENPFPATDRIYVGIKADGVEWIEGNEPVEFGRYWVRYETDIGPQYCSAQWMEYNFCASSDTNIHKIWLADHSRSINSLKGVTHYTKLPAALEGGAL